MITIAVVSVLVTDQEHALRFYADVLGFEKRQDVALGEGFRWLTVAPPGGPEGVELLLEPNAHPLGQEYQRGLYEEKIPLTSLASDDLRADYERLTAAGVVFRGEPTQTGPVLGAIFDDTCGNWIGLSQVVGG
jgi:catechol 2,3-dioxygenase-like lactoylglutathione lyase family enzyme